MKNDPYYKALIAAVKKISDGYGVPLSEAVAMLQRGRGAPDTNAVECLPIPGEQYRSNTVRLVRADQTEAYRRIMANQEVECLPVPGQREPDDGKPLSDPTADMWADYERRFPAYD